MGCMFGRSFKLRLEPGHSIFYNFATKSQTSQSKLSSKNVQDPWLTRVPCEDPSDSLGAHVVLLFRIALI